MKNTHIQKFFAGNRKYLPECIALLVVSIASSYIAYSYIVLQAEVVRKDQTIQTSRIQVSNIPVNVRSEFSKPIKIPDIAAETDEDSLAPYLIAQVKNAQSSSSSLQKPKAIVVPKVKVEILHNASEEQVSLLTIKSDDYAKNRGVFQTAFPVSKVPNWSKVPKEDLITAMYGQIPEALYIPVPQYNISRLTVSLQELQKHTTSQQKSDSIVTEKLLYSTRHFGYYNLDSTEYVAPHPGIDIKLPLGTPITSIAKGTVYAVEYDANMGRYIVIQHTLPDTSKVYSIYGHLEHAFVKTGDRLDIGTLIGTVGMTGNTTAPHLHLQVDKDRGDLHFLRFWPSESMSIAEAATYTIHPIEFIEKYKYSPIKS